MDKNNKTNRKYLVEASTGLQDVDNLKTSSYYDELSKKYINNEIQLDEFNQIIENYYQDKKDNQTIKNAKEADLVANRINVLLSDDSFSLNMQFLQTIHKFLFKDILNKPGFLRQTNISKKEWILNGDSVTYGDYRQIEETCYYDINEEKQYQYTNNIDKTIEHIATFISNIWQNHPFIEGNTRTIAVFLIKYLRFLGFKTINNTFKLHSWYFRNALVRANYSNIQKGINENKNFLIKFLRNLILGEQNELSNRQMHINALNNLKLVLSARQCAILELMKSNPNINIKQLKDNLKCSEITVKRDIEHLKGIKVLKRIGSKKKGIWSIVGLDK